MDEPAVAVPLSQWVQGTLRLTFPGAVVDQPLRMCEATVVRGILNGSRAPDLIGSLARGWMQFDASKVLSSRFEVHEDGGWGLVAEDRHLLAQSGHPHGILISLLDLWSETAGPAGAEEPSYSGFALLVLHERATDGISFRDWCNTARVFEGVKGAVLAERAHREVAARRRQRTTDLRTAAQPDGPRRCEHSTAPTETEPSGSPAPATGPDEDPAASRSGESASAVDVDRPPDE